MSLNYYTQTPNFISASSGDVDPRTRLFCFNHSLTTLVGNDGMGPSLALTLTYSPTTTDNTWGMGIGMMFTLTWYDKNARTLYLNSGETYKIDESTDGSGTVYFTVKQCKIQTFKVEKIDNGSDPVWYRVTDRDGNITELYEQDTGYYLPSTLWSPLGHIMKVSWIRDPGTGHLYLYQVTDETTDEETQHPRVLFSAAYNNGEIMTMTLLPGTSDEQILTLNTDGNYLQSMTNSALTDQNGVQVPWLFDYSTDSCSSGLQPLKSITMPTGLVKSVVYDLEAMAFPDDPNAPQYHMPAVTKLTISPGLGSPDIVTFWSFVSNDVQDGTPSKNYLGYGGNTGGVAWSYDTDASYSIREPDYLYQCVSTQPATDGSNNAMTTTYLYNNYHLLVSTSTTQDGGTHAYTVETTWYADTTKTFDEQPACFQCPKLQAETWSSPSGTHSRYTSYTYDDYGNLTQQVNLSDSTGGVTANSTQTDYTFYTTSGESDSIDGSTGCPADPYGFVYRPKTTTVTPPQVNGYSDAPVRTTCYRYISMITLNEMCYTTAILPAQDTYSGSDVQTETRTLLSRVNAYERDTSSPHYGRQVQQTTTIYDPDYNSLDPEHNIESYDQTLDTAWSFTTDGNGLTQEDTLLTHDELSLVASVTRSCLTGKTQSITDALGNTTTLTYDALGRMIQETRNQGTEYETSQYHDYALEGDTETGQYVVTAIITTRSDNAGNQTQIYHDGMGRPTTHMDNASDIGLPDDFYQTSATGWDGWGRRSSSTRQDWTTSFYHDPSNASYKPDANTPDTGITYQAQFDVWGQHCLSIPCKGPSFGGIQLGMQYFSGQDPVTLTTTTELQVIDGTLLLGRQVTLTDDAHTTETLMTESRQQTAGDDSTRQVYSTAVNEYDGLGRLRKTTYPRPDAVTLPADTDTTGWVSTSYTYDVFDRVSTSTQWDVSDKAGSTMPSAVVIQSWMYAPFAYAHLPVSVAVSTGSGETPVEMGTQTFDGLGRMTASSCGGRTQRAAYNGVSMVPDSTTNAAGQTLNYTYVSELNNSLSQVSSATGTLSQTFLYARKPSTTGTPDNTGRLLSAAESGSRSESFTWLPSGKPDMQGVTPSSIPSCSMTKTWSLQGRLVTLTDVAEKKLTLGYDSNGRLATLTDPTVTVTLGYDLAGRLASQSAVQNTHYGTDVLTTSLTLDDYGRETRRDIAPNIGDTLSIATTYTLGGQVQNRITTLGSVTLREETFTYDVRNRLTDYVCTGSAPTQDAYGNALSELHFTLDVYSNIIHCQTVLANNGGTDEAEYFFTNPDDPCQLMSVSHSLNNCYPASINLSYDANGRMTTDEMGRTLNYDEAGRLISITGTDGCSQYAYDAFDTLVTQSLSGDTRELYYAGNRLLSEVHVEQSHITRNIPGCWGSSAVSDDTLN